MKAIDTPQSPAGIFLKNGDELAPERAMFDKRLDEGPGAVPDIRAEGDSVIYVIGISGERAQLILRCSPTGAIYAALTAHVRSS